MKFDVTIEIDRIGEYSSLDETFSSRLQDAVIKKVTESLSVELTKKIAERADKLVTAKVELLINAILEQPITVTRGWFDKTEYASTFDMVEARMSQLYDERMDVSSGKCSKDPYLAEVERYVDSEVKANLQNIEAAIKSHAALEAKKAVNENELIRAIGATIQTTKNRRGVEKTAVIIGDAK